MDPGSGWDGVGPAHPEIVVDVHHRYSALLLRAAQPSAVDAAALHELRPEAAEHGAVAWMTPLGLRPEAPGTATALETAHARGRLWGLTGQVPVWWHTLAHQHNPDELPELSVETLFPGGTWAASVALLAQPDEHGVGTRTPDSPVPTRC